METIYFWNPGQGRGIFSLLNSWRHIDHKYFSVDFKPADKNIVSKIASYTQDSELANNLRTICQANNLRGICQRGEKIVFIDASDRSHYIAANGKSFAFDLIIKFQYSSDPDAYRDILSPITPFTYMSTYYDIDLIELCRNMRHEVLKTKKFTSSLFFAGKSNTNPKIRNCVKHLVRNTKFGNCQIRSYDVFLKELATTECNVAPQGTGDFTHRNIEVMSVGGVFCRKPFLNLTKNPLVPNYHYYSLEPYPGIHGLVSHFIDYFEPNGQYRDFTDEEWDEYCEIGNNGLKWYEDNSSPQGSFNLFLQILEEHNII